MKLWIRFDFQCDDKTQIKLHKILRSKISEWQHSLVDASILLYHFNDPRTKDSLYLCLNILSMNPPPHRTVYLSEEQTSAIPKEILDTITKLTSQYLINPSDLKLIDYELDLQNSSIQEMYNTNSVAEVLDFSSKGTEIALEILNDARTKNRTWKNNDELTTHIIKSINVHFKTDNEQKNGLHVVCNTLCLVGLLPALIQLYQIENMKC